MSLMRAEIEEIPQVVERLLVEGRAEAAAAARAISRARPTWASMVGRGTSDHAAIYARYLLEIELGIPTGLAAPSVTTLYHARLDWRGGLVIAVSQSGQSPDVVGFVEQARRGGAQAVAVTNDPASPLGRASGYVIECRAGPERAIAATKTYVAELAAIAMLVAELSPTSPVAGALARLPDTLRACLSAASRQLQERGLIGAVAGSDRALIASRGYNLATALEIALKLKETAAIFAEGYSTADLEHGPVALAEPDVPTLVVRPDGPVGEAIDRGLGRVRAAGVDPWVIGASGMLPDRSEDGAVRSVQRRITLPLDLPEPLTPLAFVLPGQLLAEAVPRLRGRDPDRLPGLTKVTRTL